MTSRAHEAHAKAETMTSSRRLTITIEREPSEEQDDIHPNQLLPTELVSMIKPFEELILALVTTTGPRAAISFERTRQKCLAVDLRAEEQALEAHELVERHLHEEDGPALPLEAHNALKKWIKISKDHNVTF